MMIEELLRAVPLFRELTDEELALVLMIGMRKNHGQGSVIVSEGVACAVLHVIQEGQVRISKFVPGFGEEALVILGPGQLFGEVEFFDRAPASALAIAHTDTATFALPHSELHGLMQEHPRLAAKFLWAFSRVMAGRLRESNRKMASLFAMARSS
jgi:CRP-like cAMP-binding protein